MARIAASNEAPGKSPRDAQDFPPRKSQRRRIRFWAARRESTRRHDRNGVGIGYVSSYLASVNTIADLGVVLRVTGKVVAVGEETFREVWLDLPHSVWFDLDDGFEKFLCPGIRVHWQAWSLQQMR